MIAGHLRLAALLRINRNSPKTIQQDLISVIDLN
jgi:hypothetical protein